ncbi:LytTR family transcriptional regulator DNA-binding domain-containing protein [Spirosoma rhododendri]|uniref:LytTR family transcriptional regulator n=1 Tax=Spirosoma rhododendri TaxID=2728024 RepID=A0A7L5DQ08_9BACT|nr:LytTR family transcriptional regulator DNA-binding domain-containing protein [Spirosoma rhododendri]QJD79662.1 LytTR family transcriptional regulator [Spirosoma rhododendri]
MSAIKYALQQPESIAYCTGANNYCWIHFRSGEKELVSKPISYLERKLTAFVRVHKTVLLNPSFVDQLVPPATRKKTGQVRIDTGEAFPVSRRRWAQVVLTLTGQETPSSPANDITVGSGQAVATVKPADVNSLGRTIVVVTEQPQTAWMLETIVGDHAFDYQCYSDTTSDSLADFLTQQPGLDHPALMLIDARTAIDKRLGILSRLKASSALCHIPIIVLVLPNRQSILQGYAHRANSVIAMPKGIPPEETLRRICRFWLEMAVMPTSQNLLD